MHEKPVFDVWDRSEFQDIIQTVYKLDKVLIDGVSSTVFSSVKFGKKKLFNYPFAMCGSNNDAMLFEYFSDAKNSSIICKENIIIKTLSDYPDLPRVHASNCPVLKLDNPRMKYRSKFRNKIKRHGRQADNLGVSFERTLSEDDLLKFYSNVLAETYRNKHKMLFQPYELLKSLFQTKFARLYIAKKNNKIIGGIFCCASTNVLHYNWGAMIECENISIGGLLLDYAIGEAEQEGFDWFDFGSTPLSHNKLLQFKTRFGAEVFPVYYYYLTEPPKITDYNSAWPLAREIFSYIPLAVLIRLMPVIVPYLVE